MIWLIAGVLLWNLAHLARSLGLPVRHRLTDRLGEDPVKGLVTSLIKPLIGAVLGFGPLWWIHPCPSGVGLTLP